MATRLTISQIYTIEDPTFVTKGLSILSLFITEHFIYLIDQNDAKKLSKISLKGFQIVERITLPQFIHENEIKSLVELQNNIILALNGSSDLFYINKKKQCLKVSSHLDQINQIINYKSGIVTCSKDFTLRIWRQINGFIVQNKSKHIYFGHTGNVTCLQTYQNVLISGSTDECAIFWENDEQLCQFKSSSSIVNLLRCSQSNQLVLFCQNGQIQVIDMRNVIKDKMALPIRTIKYSPLYISTLKNCFKFCGQIDDSFIIFTDLNKIVFVQVNLGQIINHKQLQESDSQSILGVKCLGRILLFGKFQSNIQLLKL